MKRSALTTIVYAMAVSAGLLAASQAFAHTHPTATPRIDQRQAAQQARINDGVAQGSLTATEQAHLQRQQRKIAAREAAAKADGVITRHERHRLNRLQHRASQTIHRAKHHAAHPAAHPAAHHPHHRG